MSLFTVGKRYQGDYLVEHVVSFFDGELAIANFLDDRYYLQSVPLVREFTTLEFHRFKKLYDELELELLLPVSDMFLEGNYAVFVYPYEPIQPIRDIVTSTGVSDEEIVGWFHKIIETELALQSMGIPMYIIRDPRNIGLNTNRELRIIFSGIEDVTLAASTINWGTFFYCVASGDYVDESLKRLPSNHSLSKPVARLIQKSFRAKSLQDLSSIVEQALKKQKGGGLIGSLFGKKKKKEQPANESQPQPELDPLTIESTSPKPEENLQQDQQTLEIKSDLNQETIDWSQPKQEGENEQSQTIQTDAVHEPDPFHQQLEEMYQAIEQENQSSQQSMDETKIYSKQEETTNAASQQPSVDDVQLANTQVLSPEQVDSALMEESLNQKFDSKVSEDAKQDVEQKSSQDSSGNDETQIFSASDLSSIEAELKEMEQAIKSQQAQEKPEQEELEQTVVQPASDDLAELEKLFGELDQVQGDQQQVSATTEQPIEQSEPVVQTEPNDAQDQSISDLDQKMQEIESLFEELNQEQLQTNAVSSVEETETVKKSETVEDTKTKQAELEIATPDPTPIDNVQEEKEIESASSILIEEKKEDSDHQEVQAKKEVAVSEKVEEDDPLEKLRIEFEQEQKKLLERQQQRLKERQQALIVEVQEELKRRQEELLKEIEEQEEKMLLELEEEFQRRKLEEMRKIELNTLKKKHEQDVKNGLEKIRKEYQEQEEQELKQLDQEYQQRREEIINQYKEKRLNEEKEFKAQKAKEWEELMKKFNEEESDEEKQTSQSKSKPKSEVEEKKEKGKSKKKSAKKAKKDKKDHSAKKASQSKKNRQPVTESSQSDQKAQAADKEETETNDELALQFDAYKKELYSEESKEPAAKVSSENNDTN